MAGVSDSEFEELPECEPAWLQRQRATACRRRLLAAGYSPLPVNGKAPPVPGWQDIVATNDIISAWEDKYPDATNTGILTGNTPAIDIDVLDSDVADEVQQIAERLIGTNAVRTGQAPKRAMLFRTDEPFDKVSTPVFISPDGRTHKVEILGRGQQIVVDGIHPDTHSPYTWQGGEPGSELNRDVLPQLNAEQAKEFIVAAAQCMSGYGWSPKKKPNGDAGGSWNTVRPASERERAYARAALEGCADQVAKTEYRPRDDDERIREALHHVGADDRDVWLHIGMALKDEMGDAARPLWDEWSRRSKKFDERDQDKTWKSFHGNKIKIGTLFHYAQQSGWKPQRQTVTGTGGERNDSSGIGGADNSGYPSGKKILRIEPGELVPAAEELRNVMAASGQFYERGTPVCIAKRKGDKLPFASPLTKNSVVRASDKLCVPTKGGEKTTLPNRVAELHLDMVGEWQLPPLRAISTAPVLSNDGSIRDGSGYDPVTGLYLHNVPKLAVPANKRGPDPAISQFPVRCPHGEPGAAQVRAGLPVRHRAQPC
jgi:hypothetical protein